MKKALAVAFACAFSTPTFAQAVQGDAKAGEKKVAMCIGCHGIPGYQASFPEVHKVPMISGQADGYLRAALVAYRKGERRHPSMRGVAGSLSDQDIADVAAYYAQHGRVEGASVPETPPAAPQNVAALLQKGACASCHGANFNKPIDANTPKLAGQHADYLYVALKAYRIDNNPTVGRANPVMATQARQFTLPELKAIANHLAALPGELKTVPQARIHAASAQ
jgi:cytochrome c553